MRKIIHHLSLIFFPNKHFNFLFFLIVRFSFQLKLWSRVSPLPTFHWKILWSLFHKLRVILQFISHKSNFISQPMVSVIEYLRNHVDQLDFKSDTGDLIEHMQGSSDFVNTTCISHNNKWNLKLSFAFIVRIGQKNGGLALGSPSVKEETIDKDRIIAYLVV